MAKILSGSAPKKPLEALIRERKLLDEAALTNLIDKSKHEGIRLADVIAQETSLGEDTVFELLAESFTFRFTDLAGHRQPDNVPARVVDFCLQESLIPASLSDGVLTVVTTHPEQALLMEAQLAGLGFRVRFLVTSPRRLSQNLNQMGRSQGAASFVSNIQDLASADINEGKGTAKQVVFDVREDAGQHPVIQLVNNVLVLAITQGASDVHVETVYNGARIRFRIDGVLYNRFDLSHDQAAAFISRLLLMASLDITEHLMPQDGGFKVAYEKTEVDIRFATVPGIYGPNIGLRLLRGDVGRILTLDQLGMNEEEHALLKHFLRFPHGIILVSGPTGSGKSTTLYAVLEVLSSPFRKIITVEDPVERRMENVQQTQVKLNRNDPERSLTFARGLRTILRLDPDIIMIGEIRDNETAEIAIQASLTGHLVLSTVHAVSAYETFTRMRTIGVPLDLLISNLHLIIAQRLVRKLCHSCRSKRLMIPEEKSLFPPGNEIDHVFDPIGCNKCLQTGYSGRIGVFELLPRDKMSVSTTTIQDQSRLQGIRSSGLKLVAKGVTDFSEIERVCGPCR